MDDALAEAVRVSERVLDHQLESLLAERLDLERLMRLGIAALAGTLAGTGLLVQAGLAFTAFPAAALAAGIAAQSTATAVASGAAPPSEVSIGPTIRDLYRNIGGAIASRRDLGFALLDQATVAERHNGRHLERTARRRRQASLLLFLGTGFVLFAMAYVVGGAMLG